MWSLSMFGTGVVRWVELPVQRRLCPIFMRDVGSLDIHECFRGLTGSQRTLGFGASQYLYYRAYTCITDPILVLQSLFLYFGSYTCITELILVFRILYLYYLAYTCLTDLILVLQILCLYYKTYSYAKVLVGTISRNISESYQILTRSYQTYTDTDISP